MTLLRHSTRHDGSGTILGRDRRARFRKLVESLHSHIVFVHDLHGKFTYMSPSVAEILGYSPAEMMEHYGARMTAESREAAVARQNRLQAGETPRLSFENEYVHKNGGVRELSVSETAVLDAAGRVVGVQGIARDITEERRTARALHRSRRRHALANEAALEGIVEWRRDQGLTHVSSRLRTLLGLDTDTPQSAGGQCRVGWAAGRTASRPADCGGNRAAPAVCYHSPIFCGWGLR